MRFLCGPKLKGQTEMNNKHHIQAKTVKTIDQGANIHHLVIGWRDTVEHLQSLQSSLASLGFVGEHAWSEKNTQA